MKITVVVPDELIGKDLEIVVMNKERFLLITRDDHKNDDMKNHIYRNFRGNRKILDVIIKAFKLIFSDEKYRMLHSYPDGQGDYYTHPGDVAKVANDLIDMENTIDKDDEDGQLNRRKKRLTSPGVGRYMKNGLGLVPGGRKNTGVAYYWKDNKEIVEKYLSLKEQEEGN